MTPEQIAEFLAMADNGGANTELKNGSKTLTIGIVGADRPGRYIGKMCITTHTKKGTTQTGTAIDHDSDQLTALLKAFTQNKGDKHTPEVIGQNSKNQTPAA